LNSSCQPSSSTSRRTPSSQSPRYSASLSLCRPKRNHVSPTWMGAELRHTGGRPPPRPLSHGMKHTVWGVWEAREWVGWSPSRDLSAAAAWCRSPRPPVPRKDTPVATRKPPTLVRLSKGSGFAALRVNGANLQGGAQDDEEIARGHVGCGSREETLRQVLPEEHDVGFHEPPTLDTTWRAVSVQRGPAIASTPGYATHREWGDPRVQNTVRLRRAPTHGCSCGSRG
jgi:hypothetical protein